MGTFSPEETGLRGEESLTFGSQADGLLSAGLVLPPSCTGSLADNPLFKGTLCFQNVRPKPRDIQRKRFTGHKDETQTEGSQENEVKHVMSVSDLQRAQDGL